MSFDRPQYKLKLTIICMSYYRRFMLLYIVNYITEEITIKNIKASNMYFRIIFLHTTLLWHNL